MVVWNWFNVMSLPIFSTVRRIAKVVLVRRGGLVLWLQIVWGLLRVAISSHALYRGLRDDTVPAL
jgi:hypothetical protein